MIKDGTLWLAVYESTPELLSSYLSLDSVLYALYDQPFCLFLDLCYAGAAVDSWKEFIRLHPQTQGMVIGSTGMNEVAKDQDSFCRTLTRVLSGGGVPQLQTSVDMRTLFNLSKIEFNLNAFFFIDQPGQVPFIVSNEFNPIVARKPIHPRLVPEEH